MELKSSAFRDGEPIPRKYSGEGQNVSPPLTWSDPPEGTEGFALVCEDPDAPRPEPFVHWLVYAIPADWREFEEGSVGGAIEGENSGGKPGYTGPMPPEDDGVHHYHFTLYALDAPIALQRGSLKNELLGAIEGNVIGRAELIGTYER